MAPTDIEQAEMDRKRLQEFVEFFSQSGRFDAAVSRNTRVVSDDRKTQIAECEFKVALGVCSRMSTLHGGAAATILDDHTSVWFASLEYTELIPPNHVSRKTTTI